MAANLSKNGVTLMAAYKDVVDGRSNTNWAVFTYEGDSSNVRLAGKGEGGLEEMVEELSSGKVMYAFCSVKDPNSGLPKYVLINWTGEGVKDFRKGVYANHVTSMANFLKGAHVTVNARAEEDVEPAAILGKVSRASGVNFNFERKVSGQSHVPRAPLIKQCTVMQKDEMVSSRRMEEEKQRVEREKRALELRQKRDKEKSPQSAWNRSFQKILEIEKGKREQHTQVSAYKKINARDEIQKTDKDQFWAQTQKEEEERRKESSRRVEEEKQRVERERTELEERQATDRQKRDNEKRAQIIHNRSFQKILEIQKRETEQRKPVPAYKKINARDEIQKTDKDQFWAQTQQKEEEERRKESSRRVEEEKQRVERERRELEERQAKDRQKRDNEKRAQIIHNSFQKKQGKDKVDLTQQVSQTKVQEEKPRQNQTFGTKLAESVQKANEAKVLISQRSFNPRDVFKQQDQQSSGLINRAPLTPQSGKLRSPFLSQNSRDGGATSAEPKRLASPSPVLHGATRASPTFTFPEGRAESAASSVTWDPPAPPPSSGPYENQEILQPADNASTDGDWSDEFEDDDDDYEDLDVDGSAGREEPLYEDLYEDVSPAKDHQLKARALYDYQAADHTEITFDPDDLITGIEKIGDGWWRGYTPDGHYGLFPANYVELL